MEGWIKLHRKILENPIVCKDADHLAVWVYLLLHATHTERQVLFNGQKITLRPGQLITGRKKIADELSVDASKVKRIIDKFKSDQQIDQQGTNKGSLITVLNWEDYQKSDQQIDQQMTSKCPTDDQQVTTNNNERIEEQKKNIKYSAFVPPTTENVREYCCEKGLTFDPGEFTDFYDSKGWMIGKNKMKDWKAAARNWERNNKKDKRQAPKDKNKFNNFDNRNYTTSELLEIERASLR